MQYVAAYLATAAAFLVIDLLWIGLLANSFYRNKIGALMLEQINWTAALLFYVLFVAGIVVFAVAPALQGGSWRTALVFGALFGFFAYATYDMTNLATLKGWPVAMVIVDMAWGTFLTGVSATAGFLITRYIFPASG